MFVYQNKNHFILEKTVIENDFEDKLLKD